MSKPSETKERSRPPERRGRRERSDAVTGVDEFDSSTAKTLEEMAAAAAVPGAAAAKPPLAPTEADLASALLSGFTLGELEEMEEGAAASSSDPFAAAVEAGASKPAAKKAIAPPTLPGVGDAVAVGDLALEDLEEKDLGHADEGPISSVLKPAGSQFESSGRGRI